MRYFTQVHCSHYLHGCGLHYNTRSKRVNEEILSRRKTSFYAKFQVHCSHCLHGCGLHYNVLSALSVKQVTKNYKTMHYPGRKPVYLQIFEFIGATVSEFRFFMRLRT